MEISVIQATTGNLLYASSYSTTNEVRIWELRLHLCQALKSMAYFSWMIFHDQALADDTTFVSAYRGDISEATILFHAVRREPRPPTEEEQRGIMDCIQLRHRSHVWTIMSRGLHMTSTLPRGTARESTLVRAITADYPPMFDSGPLPDSLTTLLLAQCDPNTMGTPPLSPLGAAIRRGEERTVELLLQYQADPQLREHAQEVPLLPAVAKGAFNCVKILLDYRADPSSTEYLPTAEYAVRSSSKVWRKSAMEVAAPFPEIVALLRTAMKTTHNTTHNTIAVDSNASHGINQPMGTVEDQTLQG